MPVYFLTLLAINGVWGVVMKLAKLSLITIFALLFIAAVAYLPQRLCFNAGSTYTFYCGTSSADCREITASKNAATLKLVLTDV